MIHLYRSAGRYGWIRRRAGHITDTGTGHTYKAAMWRRCRRTNPDWETARIHDRTFTWVTGGTNLNRPAGTRTPREFLPLHELRRRL